MSADHGSQDCPVTNEEPAEIAPDTKDWTWTIGRACPECGFDPASYPPDRFAATLVAESAFWADALRHPAARLHTVQDRWSPLEYACHVRDVHALFALRVRSMLAENAPTFANWDQDETAISERYDLQEPATVAEELSAAADDAAHVYRSVADDAWGRTGLRSNGSAFTVAAIGVYHLHDILHHHWDVATDLGLAADPGRG